MHYFVPFIDLRASSAGWLTGDEYYLSVAINFYAGNVEASILNSFGRPDYVSPFKSRRAAHSLSCTVDFAPLSQVEPKCAGAQRVRKN
jgi:hypothetical protein